MRVLSQREAKLARFNIPFYRDGFETDSIMQMTIPSPKIP